MSRLEAIKRALESLMCAAADYHNLIGDELYGGMSADLERNLEKAMDEVREALKR